MDTEFLTHKVGPLPMGAYIGLGVAGVYGYTKFRSRKATAATPTDPADPGAADTGSTASSGAYGSADGSAGNVGNVGAGGTGTVPSETNVDITTNEEWGRIVSDWLISHGRAPADVTAAVTGYLSGKPLTTVQRAIISMGITAFGVPPTGDVPIIAIPTPGPPPKGTPTPAPKGGQRAPAKPAKPKAKAKVGYYWVYRTYDNAWHQVKIGLK